MREEGKGEAGALLERISIGREKVISRPHRAKHIVVREGEGNGLALGDAYPCGRGGGEGDERDAVRGMQREHAVDLLRFAVCIYADRALRFEAQIAVAVYEQGELSACGIPRKSRAVRLPIACNGVHAREGCLFRNADGDDVFGIFAEVIVGEADIEGACLLPEVPTIAVLLLSGVFERLARARAEACVVAELVFVGVEEVGLAVRGDIEDVAVAL